MQAYSVYTVDKAGFVEDQRVIYANDLYQARAAAEALLKTAAVVVEPIDFLPSAPTDVIEI